MIQKILSLLTPPECRSLVVLLCLMIMGMLLETFSIGLVVPALAVFTNGDLASSYPQLQPILNSLGNPSQTQLVTIGMIVLVVIYLIKAVFLAFLAWRQTKFASDVRVHISQQLFTTYLRQPYTFHLQRNSAQLMRNVYTEVGMLSDALYQTMNFATEGLVLLSIGTLLLMVEPLGALIVVAVLGAAAWGFQVSTRDCIARWGNARQHHDRMRIQHLQQGLAGAKDVKLLGRERDFLSQYDEHNTEHARVAQFQATLQQLPRLWLELLAVAGLAILVLIMLARGRDMASFVPTLGVFAAAAFRLMPSVNRLLNSVQTIRYSLPAINTLHEEFKLAALPPAERSKHTQEFHTEIRLSNISYIYPAATTPALNSVSITIKKGETIGFIGASGSGKSTLVDVILGLLTPNAGKVTVDGRDIQADLRAWQDQVGYVPQAIYLTDDSLRRNVAFGLAGEQIDDAAVARAVTAAQLEDFVQSLPNGLETIVGERGIRLSGGERQRIGIARALYHDPAVLVLDEATSALDTTTEQGVMEAINALHGKKTILIVAHRLSTVADCDRLYRLEQGRLVDEAETAPTRNVMKRIV